jgi:hypothetical protein
MRLTAKPLAFIILAVIFGGVLVTSAFNWWTTESNKVPVKFTSGEAAGQYNPADIRGSYTFGDIEKNFAVPAAQLGAAFALPADTDPASFKVNQLESIYAGLEVEIGTASVRLFTAFYAGLPYDLNTGEETFLPRLAVEILTALGTLSPDRLAYLAVHTVDLDAPAAVDTALPAAAEATPAPQVSGTPDAEHTPQAEDGTVRGKTSFQELLDWGVPQERIEAVLGGPMPAPGVVIKDYVTAQGKEYSTVRDALQAEVDAVLKK